MPNFVFISISKITLKNKNKISKKLFKDISQIYVNILYIVKHDKFYKIFRQNRFFKYYDLSLKMYSNGTNFTLLLYNILSY